MTDTDPPGILSRAPRCYAADAHVRAQRGPRAANVLGPGPELGVSDLARRLGLAKSVVHRLLRTLVDERLLEQDVDTGRYRLGIKLYELGVAVSSHADLHAAVIPPIDELHHRTRDSVHVAILDGAEVVYVERREAQRTLQPLGEAGHRNFARSTATGKVLLAHLRPAELDRAVGSAELPALTPHTITDPARLRQELAAVRERGYAENREESPSRCPRWPRRSGGRPVR